MSLPEKHSKSEEITGSSNRSFGIVFSLFFLVIGLLPLLGEGEVRLWSLVVAALFFVVAILIPGILGPLNRAWLKFGLMLGKITTPIVMAIIFFLTVVPVGLIMRLFGKDLLGLKFDPEAQSYWIDRDEGAPSPASMENQF